MSGAAARHLASLGLLALLLWGGWTYVSAPEARPGHQAPDAVGLEQSQKLIQCGFNQ